MSNSMYKKKHFFTMERIGPSWNSPRRWRHQVTTGSQPRSVAHCTESWRANDQVDTVDPKTPQFTYWAATVWNSLELWHPINSQQADWNSVSCAARVQHMCTPWKRILLSQGLFPNPFLLPVICNEKIPGKGGLKATCLLQHLLRRSCEGNLVLLATSAELLQS